MVDKGIFPESFKNANIIPIFKKKSRTEKSNHRPVSILPNLSKTFERLMFSTSNQIILETFFLNSSVDFVLVTVHKIVW